MMKSRILLTLVAIGGMAMSVFAAPTSFLVNPPRWKKLALANGESVNIRKSPSAAAPRLVYNRTNVEYYDVPLNWYGYWSSAVPTGNVQTVPFEGPAPVVADSEGWYEIAKIGPKMESNGWVSGKFCKLVDIQPIEFPWKSTSPNFTWITNPDYTSQGVYGIYLSVDEMNGVADFYYGRLVDGVVVCPYTLHCDGLSNTDGQECSIEESDGRYIFRYNPQMLTKDYEVDLSKVDEEVLVQIVDYAEPAPEKVICKYDDNITLFDN